MTGLLIDEHCIVVQPSLVRTLGHITDAAILQQLHYWMPRSTMEHAGKRWVYKTAVDWAHEIGCTIKQARSAIGRLEALGVVESCQPESWQRRKWYRIDYDHPVLNPEKPEVSASAHTGTCNRPNGNIDVPEREDGSAQTGTSNKTETTAITTATTTAERPTSSDVVPVGDHSSRIDATRLATLLADLIEQNGSKRPSVTTKWITTIERMIRLDGRTPEQIDAAIRWSQADSFWSGNILSPDALRKQYDRLRLQAKRQRTAVPKGLDGVREFLDRLDRGA